METAHRTKKILVVDDSLTIRMQIKELLEDKGMEVLLAENGEKCLAVLEKEKPEVILLDVIMPEMDGIEVCRRIKSDDALKAIPVLILTTVSDVENKVKGLNAGADDYVTKPFEAVELIARVNSILRTKGLLEQLKREITERTRTEEMLKKTNEKFGRSTDNLEQTVRELAESKKIIENQNKVLSELSIRDGLTELYNYRHMMHTLQNEFSRAKRYNTDLSCLIMDLDFFKKINDSFGHGFGDYVLKESAKILRNCARESDFLSRYGGEEFVLLLPNTDSNVAMQLAERLRKAFEENHFSNESRSKTVTVSIGVASLERHQPSRAEDLLTYADEALYQAKADGRNRVRMYSQVSQEEGNEKNNMPHRDPLPISVKR